MGKAANVYTVKDVSPWLRHHDGCKAIKAVLAGFYAGWHLGDEKTCTCGLAVALGLKFDLPGRTE